MSLAPLLSDALELATVTIAGSAAAKGLYDSIFGLVAKRRAQDLLRDKISADPALKALVYSSSPEEMGDVIKDSLRELSPRDQTFIERGIHQQSRPAERRYIENLIDPAGVGTEQKS
jgi:hypothetical protein